MTFLYISKILEFRKLSTMDSNDCHRICENYLNIIFANKDLVSSFVNDFTTTHDIELHDKLFLLYCIFKSILPQQIYQSLLEQFTSTYWSGSQLLNKRHFEGFSEKNELLFSNSSSPNISHIIMKNYMEKVNLFGQFYHPKSQSFSFSTYPQQRLSYHAIFIHAFLNRVTYTHENSLYVSALMHFSTIDISHLSTSYGKLSICINKSGNGLSIHLNHEFKISPNSIILLVPKEYSFYSFGEQKTKKTSVNDHQVRVPLNEPIIELFGH